MNKRGSGYLLLHFLMALYSLTSVCSKLAAQEPFLSPKFCLYYGGMIALLGIYAIGWQQVIKHLPLTTAFANKAVTIVWSILWGALFFSESVTPGKIVGALMVVAGVVLFALAEKEDAPHE